VFVGYEQVAAGRDGVAERVAVAVDDHAGAGIATEAEQPRMEVRGKAGGQAAAAGEPHRPQLVKRCCHGVEQSVAVCRCARGPACVEQQTAPARAFADGDEGACLVGARHVDVGSALGLQGRADLGAGPSAQQRDGGGMAAEGADGTGHVDALAAGPAARVGHAVGVVPDERVAFEQEVEGRVGRDGEGEERLRHGRGCGTGRAQCTRASWRRAMSIDLMKLKVEKRPGRLRFDGRVLYLVDDAGLMRRQLEGEDLELTAELRRSCGTRSRRTRSRRPTSATTSTRRWASSRTWGCAPAASSR
jgi:hypothetical protein